MTKQNSYSRRVITLMSSSKFFWGIVLVLVLQAAWIAASGRYPMAFDEDFHFNIIRLYAHHLSPFWDVQPAGSETYGAITRDPSYLYHFLMSFPYRFVNLFTSNQTAQVLFLRALNIGLFAAGLAIFRRLLLKTGAPRAVVHGCLLVFVLIPVVPFLAAQINYDNLFIPLMSLVLLLAIRFEKTLRRREIDAKALLELLILCLLTSLVKYAFLPVFVVVTAYLGVQSLQVFDKTIGYTKLTKSLRRLGWRSGLALGIGLVIASGLFIERYGVNMVRYHTPVPDCAQVLSVRQCSAYGPWIRDYMFETAKSNQGAASPVTYMGHWLYGMWLRLFFAVDGPASNFQTKGPLLVPGLGAIIFAVLGVVVVLRYGSRVFRLYDSQVLILLTLVTVMYVAVLWLNGFQAYQKTGQPVAINGRYLLPVLLPVLLLVALSFKELFRGRSGLTLAVASVAVLSLAWGGGTLTYILRSEPSWYWPAPGVRETNQAMQRTLGPVTPGYHNTVQFLR